MWLSSFFLPFLKMVNLELRSSGIDPYISIWSEKKIKANFGMSVTTLLVVNMVLCNDTSAHNRNSDLINDITQTENKLSYNQISSFLISMYQSNK